MERLERQVANRVVTVDALSQIVNLTPMEVQGIGKCLMALRMAITPYYSTLIDPDDPESPIRKQAIPTEPEIRESRADMEDPLSEETDSPSKALRIDIPTEFFF